ncbi:inhibitor of growth proteins N-terminal histone-binding-domain-containing protein [Tricladium varicosporioides]|nr:inhibitor of growth proteins N-terminal histone-binding-domain-containing protein [Hymenoscyphus varicosporioides]
MPRDDLSIDFVGRKMPQIEHQDAAAVLDEWTNRVANLPAEIAFMQEEIAEKDRQMSECLSIINKHDGNIQKWIRMNGSHTTNPKEESYRKIILENYDRAQILQEEKVALAQKTQQVIDKHTRYLDGHIKALQDRGEFPNDQDIPSLLRPQPAQERIKATRPEPSVAAMPLGQIPNSATVVHTRHPNQYPIKPPQVQTAMRANGTGGSVSTPSTPAAPIMMSRQAREASLGANAKRQRLTGGLGVLPPSGLARHSSMTPNTPRAGTPTGGRAGSAGPRGASQKSIVNKKVAPQGSRQSGAPRKGKPTKSGLSRLKGARNKNSPSSTNESELSDADTGTGEEDDEAASPAGGRDEEMLDGEEEDATDDRKYCTCQSVSYGDMVACDNDSCPYEWFHWSCVGLKSEPVGIWICPVCIKSMKK